MKTILEELYDGHIFPAELIVPRNPEYRPLNRKISEFKETLQKKLSTEDYQSLETLLKLHCESMAMEASASFGYGFKLGDDDAEGVRRKRRAGARGRLVPEV